jgi:isochorismate pyruvate lyase
MKQWCAAVNFGETARVRNLALQPQPTRAGKRSTSRGATDVQPVTDPQDCTTMAEVRVGVDAVDAELVTLLGRRFRYMDAAARIKPTRGAVRDEARKAQVIANVRKVAAAAGVPDDAIGQFYELLVEASIAYEFDKFDAR